MTNEPQGVARPDFKSVDHIFTVLPNTLHLKIPGMPLTPDHRERRVCGDLGNFTNHIVK
jgi:hypothetical protein